MLRIPSRVFRCAVFFEMGAALLFFGSLMHHPELERSGARALAELVARGYRTPAAADPVRVYPASTGESFSGLHAGGWRPGVISLRENPRGGMNPQVYLRHELMHEASYRTCRGRLPLWAEEAAALSFSGETEGLGPLFQVPPADLERLRQRIGVGAPLSDPDYRALAVLVAAHGWPTAPCAVSRKIEQLLAGEESSLSAATSHLLMYLASGRVLESQGDWQARFPPGSLLKVPYVAALRSGSEEAIGHQLCASDTERLLQRRQAFDLDRFRLLISGIPDCPLGRGVAAEQLTTKEDRFWRRYLGERGDDGEFPLVANLEELALVLRASLLQHPKRFVGLRNNGFVETSTLYGEVGAGKRVLRKLRAMSKTGTASDERGTPLVGHLMVAWPAENPSFLALFRGLGHNGAANLGRASRALEQWSRRYPIEFSRVRVRLLSLVPRSAWEVRDLCPSFEMGGGHGQRRRVSTCGRFHIDCQARGCRSEREVSGVLNFSVDGREVVLETDPETYADAVLSAEAQELEGEARRALRAVIVWNGTHGRLRHGGSGALCDTTHCMVFQGAVPAERPRATPDVSNGAARGSELEGGGATREARKSACTDPDLLALLDRLATRGKLDWLAFSKGGTERWTRQVSFLDLRQQVGEREVIEIRRVRTKRGDVAVQMVYPEHEEIVPCEVLRNRLKLLSCPESIRRDEKAGCWIFEGIGEGHGQGVSVEKAKALARSGWSAAAIIEDAFR
jgi:hypothetical protein